MNPTLTQPVAPIKTAPAPVAPAQVAPVAPAAGSIDPQAFKKAIQWASQNPKTPQAAELQSRITAGNYNNTITSLGLKPEQFGYKAPVEAPAPAAPKPALPGLPGININGGDGSAGLAVAKALTKSEVAFGQDIAGAASAVLPESMTGIADIKKAADQHAQDVLDLTKLIEQRKAKGMDTSAIESGLKGDLENAPAKWADLYPALNKTALQVLGDAGGVALDVAAAGSLKGVKGFALAPTITKSAEEVQAAKEAYNALSTTGKVLSIARQTAKTAAAGAAIGYGFDVTSKAQENELNLKPGIGTALGAGIPLVIGGVKIAGAIAKDQAPRIVNSLIKPLAKDFSYGKNPGRAVAEEGITANSLDELAGKINESRQKVGAEIGSLSDNLSGTTRLNVESSLSPIDEAMNTAAADNNKTLLQRLKDVKEALVSNLVHTESPEGKAALQTLQDGLDQATQAGSSEHADLIRQAIAEAKKTGIVSTGDAKMADISYREALDLKGRIGDMTRWTGNASDDKAVNGALKQVYGEVKGAMNTAAEGADPEVAQRLATLNEKYADLTSAEVATKYRDVINARKNYISMPIKVGAVAGIITSIASGGAAVPVVLAGVGAAALDKALESTAVKTRVAAWLAKESPEVVAGIVEKNPGIGAVLKKAFTKEYTPIENAIADLKAIPGKEGGFIGIGPKAVESAGGKMQYGKIIEDLVTQRNKYNPASPKYAELDSQIKDMSKNLRGFEDVQVKASKADFSTFHPDDQKFLSDFADKVMAKKPVSAADFKIAQDTWAAEGLTVPKTKAQLADLIQQAQQSSFDKTVKK